MDLRLVNSVRNLAASILNGPTLGQYVTIDFDKISEVEKRLKNIDYCFERKSSDIDSRTFLIELVANSINYCYWYGRYDVKPAGGAGEMYKIVEQAFDDYYDDFTRVIHEIIHQLIIKRFPLLEERIKHLREVELYGEAFVEYMVSKYKNDNIFNEFVETFSGYASDMFLKRASLFFLQLYRRGGWYRYIVENLHVPADYQVPKMLEHFGCIKYSKELKRMIQTHQLIPTHSLPEIELRAATILVCDLFVKNTGYTISDVDWWLWSDRYLCKNPFHLTITTDY
jgi:hypothetical protein